LDYLSRLDQPNEAAERLTAVAKTLSPRFPEIVVDAALRTQAKRSIPASVMLAMWALESAFGKAVPPQSNNPFGLKARPGEDFVTAPAVEAGEARASGVEARIRSGVEARFRRFATLDEAFDTVGQLLNGPAYAAARERLPDVRGFVSGLDRWAASPNYSKLLLRIMTEDNLFRLDAVAAQTSNPPPHA
jgi:flagellum-specific peptidoglycan hydrolase FlgJ